MTDQIPSKPWWQSKTILGALSVMIVLILRHWVPELTEDEVLDVLTKIAAAIGGIVTLIGRMVAKTRIRLR